MKYKKSVKVTSLINDEYILLGAEAEGLFRRREHGVWIKRALVIAACLSVLTIGMAAILISSLRTEVPPVTETTEAEDSTSGTQPSVFYLSEQSYVRVEYLKSQEKTEPNESITIIPEDGILDTETHYGGSEIRLVLIHFHCPEGETITVTPTAHSRVLRVYPVYVDGYLHWKYRKEGTDSYSYAKPYLSTVNGEPILGLGENMTLTESATLLWQYEVRESEIRRKTVLPCIEDNFVDFKVTDAEGAITGGGSVYVGGLDIAAMTEDHTYYSGSWAAFNSIYRPYVLGSYRYHTKDGTSITEAFHAETLEALRASARDVRDSLFKDLTPDSYLFSMREFDHDHHKTFSKPNDSGGYDWGIRNYYHPSQTHAYDLYLVMSPYSDRRFLFYNFGYTEIAEAVIEIDNGYGFMVKGYYVMVDGTHIYVDESTPEGFWIVSPTEGETE